MLEKVTIPGVELPTLYVAANAADAELALEKGIPFIKWTLGMDRLVRYLLRPALEKLFPFIKWDEVLGAKEEFTSKFFMVDGIPAPKETSVDLEEGKEHLDDTEWEDHDEEFINMAKERRYFDCNSPEQDVYKLDICKYMGDLSSSVNLEVLQSLKLMPQFIGDIIDCIKVNLTAHVKWSEGYNKKLGATVGNYNRSNQLPNLIILDVSGSIPRGISATMLSLIDTLRTQVSADLIITSSISRFYPAGSKLPNPQKLRDQFGYGNESHDFKRILRDDLNGKHYGHVFSFGDYDSPFIENSFDLSNIQVEMVHHYHTKFVERTGYAEWCHKLAKEPASEIDTTWCNVIKWW